MTCFPSCNFSICWVLNFPSRITRLKWETPKDDNIIGYKIYWRDTTSPIWQKSRFVGKVSEYTLKNIVIDNYLFGVASVSENGAESLIQFPRKLIPRAM